MARKLDILIPHWQERPDEMEPMLGSLALQQNVDLSQVGVIVAYDGPEASGLPEEEWQGRYPFAVEFVHAPKGGVSATRNAAFDASTAEYVMFCDADDMFCDACGLYIVFQQMEKGFETLMSNFREETKGPDGKLVFVDHNMDRTFVHGRVHSRRFLLDKNIRFNDALTCHEDSFHSILTVELANPDRSIYCPHAFYLWRWRDDSVCRHDQKYYILKTYRNMIESNDALVDEFVRRMMIDKASSYCAFMIFDAYYTLLKQDWIDANNAEYRELTERRFAEYFRKHREKWDGLTSQEKAVISNGVRQRSVMEGMLLEPITVDQWLERVLSKY
jgi:glycosyltransferase involved in cell wall biosynthesis